MLEDVKILSIHLNAHKITAQLNAFKAVPRSFNLNKQDVLGLRNNLPFVRTQSVDKKHPLSAHRQT